MMVAKDIMQFIFFIAILTLLAVPLGKYMAHVFQEKTTFLDRLCNPLERVVYRAAGIDTSVEMSWKQYALALLVFNLLGIILLFILQLLQGHLPLNPQHLGKVEPWLAFNTAVSFVTNTNWQAYSGESTMSYLTQMVGLTVQNFLSAATGIAVVVALIRGLSRRSSKSIGNFWVDLTRSTLRVLVPLAFVFSLVLVSQGVVQNLNPYHTVHTLEGKEQVLALGPVASQEAIKELGTNGGGYFNANSAHPFENPNPLTNFLEMLAILLIPAALTITFGEMVGNKRQGRVIFASMLALFILALTVCYGSEAAGNPHLAALGTHGASALEGKEVRFGIGGSSLFAVVTTAASCGAVNAMHDSLIPLGGMVPLLQIMLGEVVFGGVGSGLYGILMFVILTVFIIGLMVGRTPEYLGKKIESRDMKMVTLAVLIPAILILLGSSIAAVTRLGTASVLNPGPHGLSEIIYAFASGAGNNGSAFAGLNANTVFYNIMLALVMFLGRFGIIIPVLAVAGNLAGKRAIPTSSGTFQTTGVLFGGLLIATIIIVGALTFFPALALGPVVEHLIMWTGQTF